MYSCHTTKGVCPESYLRLMLPAIFKNFLKKDRTLRLPMFLCHSDYKDKDWLQVNAQKNAAQGQQTIK